MSIKAHGPGSPRNGMPRRKPYVYHGAERARAARARALLAGELGLDLEEPGYEYRREALLAEAEETPVPAPVQEPQPAGEPPRCERCGYLVTWCPCPEGPTS